MDGCPVELSIGTDRSGSTPTDDRSAITKKQKATSTDIGLETDQRGDPVRVAMEDDLAVNEDFIQSPSHKAAGITLLNFDGLLSTPLKLHEDLREGCGGQLWPAGMVLARYLLRIKKDEMQDKTMLVRSYFLYIE